MIELGKKDEIFGAGQLRGLKPGIDFRTNPRGRPESMPVLQKEEEVIAGYDQGLGERMIVCEVLEEMQSLHDYYAKGFALNLLWYAGKDPGFIFFFPGQEAPKE